MKDTLEELAQPLKEKRASLVSERKKLVAELAELEEELKRVEDGLEGLEGRPEDKSKESKSSAPNKSKRPLPSFEEVRAVVEQVTETQPALAAEDIPKEVEKRMKEKGYRCSGQAARVKKILAETTVESTPVFNAVSEVSQEQQAVETVPR